MSHIEIMETTAARLEALMNRIETDTKNLCTTIDCLDSKEIAVLRGYMSHKAQLPGWELYRHI